MMKKIVIIISIFLFVLVVLVTGGIIYLNNVFLPRTIKALIVQGIEEQTNTKVTLESLRVNIFKGLVLKNLSIYKEENTLIRVKEVSCVFLPWSLLEKKIAIPVISLRSPQIFLERRKNNSLNLDNLFSRKADRSVPVAQPSLKTGTSPARKGFTFIVYRVHISNAKIIFQDSTFDKPFSKAIENLNAVLYLTLPASVKFKLSGLMAASQPVNISASGEFKLPAQELNAKLNVNNFSPGDFAVYYAPSGLKISGLINAASDLNMKANIFSADTQIQSKNLNIQQENISINADTNSRIILEYGLGDKKIKYSGSSRISDASISGLKFVDKVSAVNCGLIFNDLGLSTENLTANILGIPVRAKVILSNFNDPAVSINADSSLSLAALQAILKDKFKFNFPGTMDGQANLSLTLEGPLKAADGLTLTSRIDVADASVKLAKLASPIQNINGRITFTRGPQRAFPLLDISLKSDTLSLASVLSLQDKLIKVSKCSGRYFSSEFSLIGNIDTASPAATNVDLNGELRVDLKDLKYALPKLKVQLDKIKPEGKIRAQFNLSGNINDPKGYTSNAQLSSDTVSLYGLKGTDLFISYAQANGLASVEAARLSLYGGSLEAAFTANLGSKDIPYWFTASLQGVEIKELKNDTWAKSKDISGIIQAGVKANGFLSGLADSQGAGRISITKGKLWELDLFKGLGKLLFSQDLANVTFYEGTCEFIIQDKSISTDNLMLKSNMVNLSGPVRIGFDNSLNAKLNVNILDEFIPLSGTFKDVATAIIGQSGKFAVITISGTLKEPKYKFQASVTDIIKGLADTFLKRL